MQFCRSQRRHFVSVDYIQASIVGKRMVDIDPDCQKPEGFGMTNLPVDLFSVGIGFDDLYHSGPC